MIRIVTCITLGLLAVAASVHACNVPVFRFSLERWRPDQYELVVLQRGPLTAAETTLVASLERRTENNKCNLGVSTIDWNKISAEDQKKLQETYKIPQFPWVIVRYPSHVESDGPAYAGPLEAEALRNLLDSPARTELARRLLIGDSAVWLLLESGDAKKDDEAAANLRTWLSKLEKTLKLPELTNSVKDKLLREDLPLKMSFSILRVSRAVAAEKHFVHILRHMEKDLSRSTEPIVVPVFGRGLALYAIIGKGITEGNVTDAAKFLTGACSCEVKQLNPGVDLLMSTDWDGPHAAPPAQSRTAEEPVTLVKVEIPQPAAKKAEAERLAAQAKPQPSSAISVQATKPPLTSEAKAEAEPAEASVGFLRLGNPILMGGVCLLLGAIALGYYGRYVGPVANRN